MQCHERELLPYMIGLKFPNFHKSIKTPCAALKQHGIDLYLKCFIKNGFCKKSGAYSANPFGKAFVAEVTAWIKAGEMSAS